MAVRGEEIEEVGERESDVLLDPLKRQPNDYLGFYTRLQPDIIVPKDAKFFIAYCKRDNLLKPRNMHYFLISGYRTETGDPVIINSIGKVDQINAQWMQKSFPWQKGNIASIETEPVPYDVRKYLSQTDDTIYPAKTRVFEAKFYSVPLDDIIKFSDNIQKIQDEYRQYYQKPYKPTGNPSQENGHGDPEFIYKLNHYQLISENENTYTFGSTQLDDALYLLHKELKGQLYWINRDIKFKVAQTKTPLEKTRIKLYHFLQKTKLVLKDTSDIDQETKLPKEEILKNYGKKAHLNFIFQLYEFTKLLQDFEDHQELFYELGGERNCDYVKKTLANHVNKHIKLLTENFSIDSEAKSQPTTLNKSTVIAELTHYMDKLNTLYEDLNHEKPTPGLKEQTKHLVKMWDEITVEIDDNSKKLKIYTRSLKKEHESLVYLHNTMRNCFHFAYQFLHDELPQYENMALTTKTKQTFPTLTRKQSHTFLHDPLINSHLPFPNFPGELRLKNGRGIGGINYYPRFIPRNWETENNFYRFLAANKLNVYLNNHSLQEKANANERKCLNTLLQLHDAILESIMPKNTTPLILEDILLEQGINKHSPIIIKKAKQIVKQIAILARYERHRFNYIHAFNKLNKAFSQSHEETLKEWSKKVFMLSDKIVDKDHEKTIIYTRVFEKMAVLLTSYSKIMEHCDKDGKIPSYKYHTIQPLAKKFLNAYSMLHDIMPSQVSYKTKNRDKLLVTVEIYAGIMLCGVAAALTFFSLGVSTPITASIFAVGAVLTTGGMTHAGKLVHTAFFAEARKHEKEVCQLLENDLKPFDIRTDPATKNLFKHK